MTLEEVGNQSEVRHKLRLRKDAVKKLRNKCVNINKLIYKGDKMKKQCAGGGAVYGMGLIGALIYNIQYAGGFSQILWGIFKSIFWPGFLVYEILSRLHI